VIVNANNLPEITQGLRVVELRHTLCVNKNHHTATERFFSVTCYVLTYTLYTPVKTPRKGDASLVGNSGKIRGVRCTFLRKTSPCLPVVNLKNNNTELKVIIVVT
jgi:hypothetical protein